MRRKVYWNEHGEQVAKVVDDPKDRHKSRNVNARAVGEQKEKAK